MSKFMVLCLCFFMLVPLSGLRAENPSLPPLFAQEGTAYLSTDGENRALPRNVFKLHSLETGGCFLAFGEEAGRSLGLKEGIYLFNKEGDATAYVDPEFEEGDYAVILGGELFPNQMLVVWIEGKGKQSVSLGGAAVPNWWGAYCDGGGRCLGIANFRTGTYFSFTFSVDGKDVRGGTAVIVSEDGRTAGGESFVMVLEPDDRTVHVTLDPQMKPEPCDDKLVGVYVRSE